MLRLPRCCVVVQGPLKVAVVLRVFVIYLFLPTPDFSANILAAEFLFLVQMISDKGTLLDVTRERFHSGNSEKSEPRYLN